MYGYRMVFLVAALVIWAGAAFFAIGQKFFLKNFSVSATAKENLKEKKEMAKIPLTSAEKRRMWVILILAFEDRGSTRRGSKGECIVCHCFYYFPEYWRDVFCSGWIWNGK